jgi:hypothetical protein
MGKCFAGGSGTGRRLRHAAAGLWAWPALVATRLTEMPGGASIGDHHAVRARVEGPLSRRPVCRPGGRPLPVERVSAVPLSPGLRGEVARLIRCKARVVALSGLWPSVAGRRKRPSRQRVRCSQPNGTCRYANRRLGCRVQVARSSCLCARQAAWTWTVCGLETPRKQQRLPRAGGAVIPWGVGRSGPA